MKIGTLGAGKVAQTLGLGFTAKGHHVLIGSRCAQTEALAQWQEKAGAYGRIGSLPEAAAYGDIILLAINPWPEIEGVLKALDAQTLVGKVLIDLSNNIEFGTVPRLAFHDRTMGELIQEWLPETHVVKTLNALPAALMVNPAARGVVPSAMWVAGNQPAAKATVTTLLHDLGWDEVFDLGDIRQSRLQEAFGLLTSIVVTDLLAQAKG